MRKQFESCIIRAQLGCSVEQPQKTAHINKHLTKSKLTTTTTTNRLVFVSLLLLLMMMFRFLSLLVYSIRRGYILTLRTEDGTYTRSIHTNTAKSTLTTTTKTTTTTTTTKSYKLSALGCQNQLDLLVCEHHQCCYVSLRLYTCTLAK